MTKRVVAALGALALLAMACGGSDDPNPAAFTRPGVDACETVPAQVPGISVVGQRLESVEDVKVCVKADVEAKAVPVLKNQPDCGNPCFTIEIAGFAIDGDARVAVTYARDGKAADPISYDPEPVGVGPDTGRICVIGVGSPDPCVERITTPKTPTVSAMKRKLRVGWGPSTDTGGGPLAGYEVWRSDTGAEGTFTLLTSTASTSHLDQGLSKGQTAYYFVVAYDTDGNHSAASEVVSGTAK